VGEEGVEVRGIGGGLGVRVCGGDLVLGASCSQEAAALLGNHGQQETNDRRQEGEARRSDFLSENVARLMVPVSAFACGTQRVLVETSPIQARATRVTFGNIRADPSQRTVELIRQRHCALVSHQPSNIMPPQIRRVQREPIHFHPPERISRNLPRHRLQPFLISHIIHFHASRFTPHGSRFTPQSPSSSHTGGGPSDSSVPASA